MWKNSSDALVRQLADLRAQGQITRRQSSYWDVGVTHPGHTGLYRIHFRGKWESRFEHPPFSSFSLHSDHQLLVYYLDYRDSLSFHGRTANPVRLLRSLEALALRHSEGWRPLSSYLNSLMDPVDLLESGGGVLLEGPRSLVREASELLHADGLEPTVLERQPPKAGGQLLLLPPNFVIAEVFRAQLLSRGEAAQSQL